MDNNIKPVQAVQVHTGLSGTERYGSVHNLEVEARMPSYVQSGTALAPPSGVEYEGEHSCIFVRDDGSQCKGPKAKDTDFCIGHLRSIEKAQKEAEESAE